ncbi:hypothetical protein ATE92_1677 [Ulvibacter sp. MAR_2010_11]|uniref:hypothetical protein n=1 Tax=Ulvibacter sp. MAR_2010_11 TaxID=1250229 RepID=UPI000CB11A35|nr:hypothetical protein [Ulvibacter sp. MAR_2010_11]PKA83522.1 hypothetical protein ATE92_1677 [Ulvibacter sp. MAR_2010_11]
MMKIYTKILLTAMLIISMLFVSCQKEEQILIDENPEETITANSVLTNFILLSTQNDCDYDDIIDNHACGTVVLPVTVIVNGQEVVVSNEDDFATVQAIFDQFPGDEDTIEIVFPIDIQLKDYSQQTVNNQSELDAFITICEASGYEGISCVDFNYPVRFFVYNSNQQQTGTESLSNDIELYQFLNNLDVDDFISIDYPVSAVIHGETFTANNNPELQEIISSADCYEIDPNYDIQFIENLTSGNWYVSYYFDNYEETSSFGGYAFTFAGNNSAQASNGTTIIDGSWNVTNNVLPYLDLDFGTTTPFNKMDFNWEIIEGTSEIIRLRKISSGDGSVDYLSFNRTPSTGGNNEEVNNLIEILTTGIWYVNLYNDNGTDETCDYVAYEFTYFLNGTATATTETSTITGFWAVENSNGLELVLNFDNGGSGSPLGDLNDDWSVIEATLDIIRLEDSSSGGGTDLLSFGRNPYDCGGGGGETPDPQELRDIMQVGTWYVDTFLDNGDNETADYNGFDFRFYANETVLASNGSESVYGIWIVTLVGDSLNFEFDMDSPLNGADDADYKVLQFSETSVTFVTRDSGGNIEDTLTFKKN